jgi:16S rRNA A1518/A1519 N6-dimethyltransferase RsmA/KsgA/DIM1 with predicted DNA glycosylase/AP lyase activity
MPDLKTQISLLVKGYNLSNLEAEGQNFLVDEKILETEIAYSALDQNDTVLDIGAGFGSIEEMVSKVCKVIAVEKDVKLYSYLINKYELNANVHLINADIMKLVIPAFNKIIANPPYPIIDRILAKLTRYDFESGVLIMPKTITERLVDKTGEKSTNLSLIINSFFRLSIITEVQKEAFYPSPRVTSEMVKIERIKTNLLQEVLRRDEMTVKNAIRRAYEEMFENSKRESLNSFGNVSKSLNDMQNIQVKKLSKEQLQKLIDTLIAP